MPISLNGRRKICNKYFWENEIFISKRIHFYPTYKYKIKNIDFQEGSRGKFHDVVFDNIFVDMMPKAKDQKRK